MSWVCPECKINYGEHRGRGICSCYEIRGYTVKLIWEDDTMANTIEYTGNKSRFAGQKKARLLNVEVVVAKQMSAEIREHVGKDIPLNSVRQYLLCHYTGEKGVPYADVLSYGGARLLKLQKAVGTWFDVDCPDDAEPIQVNFSG